MDVLGVSMGFIMRVCYQLVNNYGFAIILFALITKIVLFPVSLWVHSNGIKMVRIQPAINRLKIKYFGDNDKIADEQLVLFKKEKYNPFGGIVPILLQLVLLIGLIQVVYHPLSYMLHLPKPLVESILQNAHQMGNIDIASSSAELFALNFIQNIEDLSAFSSLPGMTQEWLSTIKTMDMTFLGLNMTGVPSAIGGKLISIPIIAALASIVLSLSQNVLNPLQAQQGKIAQYGSMLFSVGISLILGFFVPSGVGFYWIWSNLFGVLQQVLLNIVYNPNKHIDYVALKKSKEELEKYQQIGSHSKKFKKAYAKQEKKDYKRFFSIVNKHIVFYSESNGFFKYFSHIIQYLLDNTNMTIHYITSDPEDQIFSLAEKKPQIKPYYIGEKKLITLFMKLEADVVVMTMSDLEKYHYKRSYMRKDMEYVYVFHYPLSTHMVLNKGALDHYDTIFCIGSFQFDEIRKTEEIYDLPQKELVLCGYGQLESLYDSYKNLPKINRTVPKVLIAPSWQEDNILDTCIDDLLQNLLGKGLQVVVRPHPEYVKRYGVRMNNLINRYNNYVGEDLSFELDFTSNASIYDSDIVITDWSGTAYEFSLVTQRPSVFIDTPPKINNPEYDKLDIPPLEFELRNQIGIQINPQDLDDISDKIIALIGDSTYNQTILDIRNKYIANFGTSGEVGGAYLIEAVQKQIQSRSQTKS